MIKTHIDFEVTPNWWCCTFGDYPEDGTPITEDIKKNFVTVDSDDPKARDAIVSYLMSKERVIFGYNLKGYDLIIANAVYNGFSPQKVFIVSDLIINPDKAYSSKEYLAMFPFASKRMRGVAYEDLLDDNDGSLKEKEAILGLNILESNVSFLKEDLTEEEKNDLKFYNRHDVYASIYYFDECVKVYCETKQAIGKHFHIDENTCYSSTNARLVSIALKARRREYSDENLERIELPEKIRKYCNDNCPSKILNKLLTSKDSFVCVEFGNVINYGNGGIHSVFDGPSYDGNDGLYVESNNEWILVNVDAESYYPSMMIQFDLLSRSVSDKQVFIDIFNERMAIKHKAVKTEEDELVQKADKLILNTTFGASGNKYLDLYDLHTCTTVCRVGQIFLTALACRLYNNVRGLKIIQSNTDGILCYFRRKDLEQVRAYMKEWTEVSGINLEEDIVEKIWQKNVNNYLLVKEGGKIKSKGAWLNESYKTPSVKVCPRTAYICAKAAKNYLLNNEPVERVIDDGNDFKDFVITCTKGPTFKGVIQKFNVNGIEYEQELYKANRVVATTDERNGKLYKWKNFKGSKRYNAMPSTPDHCLTLNKDLSEYKSDEIFGTLDYCYYYNRAKELLNVRWFTIGEFGQVKKSDRFARYVG